MECHHPKGGYIGDYIGNYYKGYREGHQNAVQLILQTPALSGGGASKLQPRQRRPQLLPGLHGTRYGPVGFPCQGFRV